MRTTIRIDADLYRRAKAHSARSGRTVSQLIEDAVRTALQPRCEPSRSVPELSVYGGTGLMPGVDLTSGTSLRDLMGVERTDALY